MKNTKLAKIKAIFKGYGFTFELSIQYQWHNPKTAKLGSDDQRRIS